jgi:hypothetical protein
MTRPRVIVVVEGGVVSAVLADRTLNLAVLDHDNWKVTDRTERPEEWSHFALLLKETEGSNLQPQLFETLLGGPMQQKPGP